MPDFEFVFATAPYGEGDNRLWIRDPPGGKGEPTQDPAFADASIQELNAIVESEGPFYGLLGYSQGAAFVPVYLSRVPVGTFQVAISFCGYLTETHQGILQVVNENSPFGDIPHLVWMGQQDYLINNGMTNEMAAIFTNPNVVVSPTGGHAPPGTFDPTFDQVTAWIRQQDDAPTPSRAPTSSSPFAKPTRAPSSSSPVAKPTKAPYAWPDKPTWGENPWPDKPTLEEKPALDEDKDEYDDDEIEKDCVDDASLRYKNRRRKNCVWVGRKPEKRCRKRWNGVRLYDYCPEACGKCF